MAAGIAVVLFIRVLPPDITATGQHPLSLSNIKQLAIGAVLYQNDYDGRLPIADRWSGEIYPYVKNFWVYRDPLLEIYPDNQMGPPKRVDPTTDDAHLLEKHPELNISGDWGYAFDSRLSKVAWEKLKKPEMRLMLFTSKNFNWNANDAFISYRVAPSNGALVGFADGHAKPISADRLFPGAQQLLR